MKNGTRVLLTTLLFSAALSAPPTAAAAAGPPPAEAGLVPGRLVDVGGFRLNIRCAGEGSPTVVVDAGAGGWSLHFADVQAALVGDTRVCTYDRAGLGESDPGPAPRTSGVMVEELHTLLHKAGVAPPLLLVGHSLGGYNVRLYQARYPEEVGGIVLLDAAHEAQFARLPGNIGALLKGSAMQTRATGEQVRQGQIKAADVPPGIFGTRLARLRDKYARTMLKPTVYEAIAAETEGGPASAAEVPSGRSLGNLPLVVLTARRSFDAFAGAPIPIEEANAVWLTLQDELAALSTQSVHLFSERGDHRLMASDPDAIVDAVWRGVQLVRDRPAWAAGLAVPTGALPARSTPEVDRLLSRLEDTYHAMDADGFTALFTDDVSQLDVNRRVHVKGRERWVEWTRTINAAHRAMDRVHRGRARIGDWIVVEIEWSGVVRGEALGSPGHDRPYRYTGLGLMRLVAGRIQQQILYGDYATLTEQLAGR